ncbi:MAG: hypothetical protein J5I91_07625 [Bacteroidetes bacterium]|nr:hypothetical protein [Bacteroidota bacterium]
MTIQQSNSLKTIIYSLVILLLIASCHNKQNQELKEQINFAAGLPTLIKDSTIHLKVGDSIQITSSWNSCCVNAWICQGVLCEYVQSPLLEFVGKVVEESEPGCDGCTDYTYRVYRCTKAGVDSVAYINFAGGDFTYVYTLNDKVQLKDFNYETDTVIDIGSFRISTAVENILGDYNREDSSRYKIKAMFSKEQLNNELNKYYISVID